MPDDERSEDTSTSTSVVTVGGDYSTSTTTGGGGTCQSKTHALSCTLYVCTGVSSGNAGNDQACQDHRVAEWAKEAIKKRRSSGVPVASNVKKSKKLGPQKGKQWAFAAILEYSCDCNPSPSLNWYITNQTTPKGGKVKFGKDPADGAAGTMEEVIEKQTIKKDYENGNPPGSGMRPITPSSTQGQKKRPKMCYIMAVDTPTKTNLGKKGTGWLIRGHVTWTCEECGEIHTVECEDMATVWMQFGQRDTGARGGGKRDQVPGSSSKVKHLDGQQQQEFKESGKAPPPWE
ncbi:MAG: hypothetical protein H6828_06765 [Planctomycetes bacterium]|nr:hypothetical protein [Planctomycetota bacterium]